MEDAARQIAERGGPCLVGCVEGCAVAGGGRCLDHDGVLSDKVCLMKSYMGRLQTIHKRDF